MNKLKVKLDFTTIKIASFSFIFLVVMLLSVFLPKEMISFYENRELAKFPEITINTIFDGAFFSEVETYTSDHLLMREKLIKISTIKDMSKAVIHDVVITNEAVLPYFESVYEHYDYNSISKMVLNMSNLQTHIEDYGGNFLFVGIPEQSRVFIDSYPYYLNNSRYKDGPLSEIFFQYLDGIHTIDMYDAIGTNPSKYYSSTDHHYNLFGAYETYIEITNYINENFFEVNTLENVVIQEINSDFLGSRTRKLLGLYKNNDKLYTFQTETHVSFERFDNGNQVESLVFSIEESNNYNFYMGGDHAETIIKTYRDELPNALIFGDSFTNPIETMLYTSFNEFRSLDFRYYTEKSVYEYIDEFKPDIVIFVRDGLNYDNLDGNGKIGE